MRGRPAVAALLILAVSGCGLIGGQDDGKRRPKMNMQQAAERADAILDDTFAAIKPPVQWTHRQAKDGSCSTDRPRAVLTIISPERRGSFMGLVDRHWKSKGFTLRGTSQDKQAAYYLTPDGFQVSLLFGWKGQAHFEVTTPCVEPSEVRPPTTRPNGPDYSKEELPAPYQHSDFWSAGAPADGPSPDPS